MIIILKEQLTIQQISAPKGELAMALDKSRKLTVDLSEADEVDTAFLQLLCAVRNAAVRDNKEFTLRLAADSDNSFRNVCRDVGVERLCPE